MKHLRIRVSDDLYEKLTAAAGSAPLTADVVRRLEQSFDREAVLNDVRQVLSERDLYQVSTPSIASQINALNGQLMLNGPQVNEEARKIWAGYFSLGGMKP